MSVVKEVLRWRPPKPIGTPHKLEQGERVINTDFAGGLFKLLSDDIHDGFFLPKDSTVICNIWAIHTHPERYDEPGAFKPERFINHKMSAAESVAQGDSFKRDHFAFGAGACSISVGFESIGN
ncbi:hypothetical protein FRC10_007017 [Ceratobasidium sp. 414]|nr:hypothetical protein FRC10_007017 [Ceratobasidium sp. 414]